MATDIADSAAKAKLPPEEALGTTLFTFTVATLLVGLLTALVGERSISSREILSSIVPVSAMRGAQ